jgi:hypothetical protein
MNDRGPVTVLTRSFGLLLILVMIAVINSSRVSAHASTTRPSVKTAPPASTFSTFYCDYPFDQYTPYFHLDPTMKMPVYVGTNPKHFRLAVHDPTGAVAVAILGGSTTVPIPLIPATVDVEAATIDVQNNGTQAADVCYFYLP